MTDDTVLLGGPDAAPSLATKAPVFAPLVERFGPARVDAERDAFTALVRAVANQQLSVAAAATVFGRVVDLCGGDVRPEPLLDASPDELRACGLSRPKVGYVQGIARAVDSGDLDLDAVAAMPDDEMVDALTELKGVGVWTAHMLQIFTFHRPDVLPTGDLGIVDGARIILELDDRPSEDELEALAEPWRPYRSVASWYIWHERDRIVRRGGGLGD